VIGAYDFEKYVGVTGNALDFSYEMSLNIPRMIALFADSCVAAAQIDPKYCPFASASLKLPDPTTDVVNRIKNIVNYLGSTSSLHDPQTNLTYTFGDVSAVLVDGIGFPQEWPIWAQFCLDIETTIQSQVHSHQRRDDTISSVNLSFSSINERDIFSGSSNQIMDEIFFCLDNSFQGINDSTSFATYLSGQIKDDPLIAYQGIGYADCIGWPNLASYNPEKYTESFPSNIHNKMIIIAEPNNPFTSINASINAYQFVGPENAVILIHDGIGIDIWTDINNCTLNTAQAYFANSIGPYC
jgi:hypothetical protein